MTAGPEPAPAQAGEIVGACPRAAHCADPWDPHVTIALILVLVAILIVFVMTTISIPDERQPRKRRNGGDQ
jgi:hypothetical protein